MKLLHALSLSTIFSSTLASTIPLQSRHGKKPAAFYLAGDSTTAAQSLMGGGWGVGFLKTLTNDAIGTDLGYNGATTVSYVNGGQWANVIDAVTRAKSDYTPYVTIQFGHNDQKAAANISIELYSANLKKLAGEAVAAGATPILVTPLSRRNYNSSGLIIQNLEPQRVATIAVAKDLGISYIDLNDASTKYLNSIGSANAVTYNLAPADNTHLNPTGSVVFGDLVSWLITATTGLGKEVGPYTKPDRKVVESVLKGVYVFPSV